MKRLLMFAVLVLCLLLFAACSSPEAAPPDLETASQPNFNITLSPKSGPPGTVVTVRSGRVLSQNARFSFRRATTGPEIAVKVTRLSSTQLRFTVPSGISCGPYRVSIYDWRIVKHDIVDYFGSAAFLYPCPPPPPSSVGNLKVSITTNWWGWDTVPKGTVTVRKVDGTFVSNPTQTTTLQNLKSGYYTVSAKTYYVKPPNKPFQITCTPGSKFQKVNVKGNETANAAVEFTCRVSNFPGSLPSPVPPPGPIGL